MNAERAETLPEHPPEPGQLVQVRSRRWLVEEVTPPANPGESARVALACADDDNQGQSLAVFWDYEPDRRILEDDGWEALAGKGFDQPRQFAAFYNTLRWHCTTATDPNLFQAPFRAGIKIDAYQIEPLRKALLLPRVNLFIADDTGLGKTIEVTPSPPPWETSPSSAAGRCSATLSGRSTPECCPGRSQALPAEATSSGCPTCTGHGLLVETSSHWR